MTPFADFLYFALSLYVVIPTLVVRLFKRLANAWIILATLGMLALQYTGTINVLPGTPVQEIWIVGAYAVLQWAVARGFLWSRPRTDSRWVFYAAVILSLLPLAAAKWEPLLLPGSLIGFLGISYVTFRGLDVIFGIRDRVIKALPTGEFLAYLFFFPTISAGPIDRYRRFAADWNHARTGAEFRQDVAGGMHRILTGLLYKFILAYLVKHYWLDPVANGGDLLSNLSYMYAYSFYLFFDFAGYSALAIGLSYFFGIHTPENFDKPFFSYNIRDFWNRWHISLSFWFRDHIYMRFLLAATKGKWFKGKYVASYAAYFVSFGLMGLWHGTAWFYLLYGVYHAVLLVAHDILSRWNKQRKLWREGPIWRAAGILLTFQMVCLGFFLFSGHLDTPATAAAAVPHQYDGYHSGADCNSISGWAWDASLPDARVSVNIYDGATLLATVPADQYRADLQKAGKGDGTHGFSYAVPSSLKDAAAHKIRVAIAGANFDLKNTPRFITCASDRVTSMAGYEGYQGKPNCTAMRGWAWDASRPDTPISVDIYDGNTYLTTVNADRLQEGLITAGKGNGAHSFLFNYPPSLLDGRPHAVRVRISETNIDLNDSPATIQCSPHAAPAPGASPTPAAAKTPKLPQGPAGLFEIATCARLHGWAVNGADLNATVSVDILDGATLLATVPADQFRQDLLTVGLGNGKHLFVWTPPASLKDHLQHTLHVRIAGTTTELKQSPQILACPGP